MNELLKTKTKENYMKMTLPLAPLVLSGTILLTGAARGLADMKPYSGWLLFPPSVSPDGTTETTVFCDSIGGLGTRVAPAGTYGPVAADPQAGTLTMTRYQPGTIIHTNGDQLFEESTITLIYELVVQGTNALPGRLLGGTVDSTITGGSGGLRLARGWMHLQESFSPPLDLTTLTAPIQLSFTGEIETFGPGSWTKAATLPQPTWGAGACALNGVVYILGGGNSGSSVSGAVYAWNPATNSWAVKAPMPTARATFGAAAVDGILYAIGGGTADAIYATVEAYNPQTNRWSVCKPMSKRRIYVSASVVNGIIYAIGGASSQFFIGYLPDVEAYDPKANQWTSKKPMPEAGAVATCVVNGIIYALGGSHIFAYDPSNDTWTTKAAMVPTRYLSGVSARDGLIYLFGGLSPAGDTTYCYVVAYDPVADLPVAKRNLPLVNVGAFSTVAGGRIYVMGGRSGVYGGTTYDTVYQFDPCAGVYPTITAFQPSANGKLHMAWEAEPGIKYAVEASFDVTRGLWSRQSLQTGNTITATNQLVELELPTAPSGAKRFYHVVETY
jgi:N-acetylneuraminic acid mutarotase